MASRKSRKRPVDYSAIWHDVLPRVLNGALLVCVLFNFLALGYGIVKNNPKEVHHVDSVVTNHFFVVTQFVASVSSPSNVSSPGGVSDSSQLREISTSYHFMQVNGRPMFRYFGQNYGVGDLTSYGRVLSVFPDRVTIEGSFVLRNDRNPDGEGLLSLKPPNSGGVK